MQKRNFILFRLLRKPALAFLAGYVVVLPYLRLLMDVSNRESMHYAHSMYFEIVLLALIFGVAFLLVREAASRLLRNFAKARKYAIRIVDSPVIALLIIAAVSIIWRNQTTAPFHLLSRYFRDIAFLVTGALIVVPGIHGIAVSALKVIAKLLFPLPIILTISFLTFKQYEFDSPDFALDYPKTDVAGTSPAFVILFDGFDRSVVEESIFARDDIPALSRFIQRAEYYENAISPADNTAESIPRIIAQSDSLRSGRPKLLERLSSGGSKVVYIGNEFDYSNIPLCFAREIRRREEDGYGATNLPSMATSTEMAGISVVYPFLNSSRHGFATSARCHLYNIGEQTYVPFKGALGIVTYREEYYARLHGDIHSSVLSVIAAGRKDVVLFAHYSIPHPPFVFDENGLRDPLVGVSPRDTMFYLQQAKFAAKVLGELLAAIENAGTFDAGAIVVTSDHGFFSPGETRRSRNVPLFIKRGGDTRGRRISEPVELQDLSFALSTP
ncbi:MAG: hypothetical protein NUW37_09960 [Planctomycetes bacterium]|nr:hypothetical protein [Planctomycetota bacterium]